jgi:hypothetical protein
MNNLNDLKEEIKQRLIFSKGDFNINQHNDLIDFANSINITPNDLLFIVLDIESSINWDEIDKLSTSNTSQLETYDDSNDNNYTTVSQRQFEKLESNNIIDSSTPNKRINITKTILLSLFAIVFLISVYLFWGKDYIRDLNAKRMYSIASSLKLRSDAYDGSDYNVIGNILFGSELLVYEDENSFGADWVNCKYDNKNGYASSKYILDKPNFFLLESIYANSETKELVGQTRYKKARALLNEQKFSNINEWNFILDKLEERI